MLYRLVAFSIDREPFSFKGSVTLQGQLAADIFAIGRDVDLVIKKYAPPPGAATRLAAHITKLAKPDVLADKSKFLACFSQLVVDYREFIRQVAPRRDADFIAHTERFGHLTRIAMELTPEWKGLCGTLAVGAPEMTLEGISASNISKMKSELGALRTGEAEFLKKLAAASVVLSHGTDYGREIQSQGYILCGPLVPIEVGFKTSARNKEVLKNEHHIFVRVSSNTEKVEAHRYGRSVLIFDTLAAQRDFFEKGWFTTFDPLKPFVGSLKELRWPKEFAPLETGDGTGPILRKTDWNDEAGKRFKWTHRYASGGGSREEKFGETVFVGKDFHLAIGLKVLVELRGIQGEGSEHAQSVGWQYRSHLLDASPAVIAAIVYRDFFRIEGKIPGVMSVEGARLVETFPTFRCLKDGITPFPFSDLDPAIRGLQELPDGAIDATQKKCLDLNKAIAKIGTIGKNGNLAVKVRSRLIGCNRAEGNWDEINSFKEALFKEIKRVSGTAKIGPETDDFLKILTSWIDTR